jgi:hypothetical protein
MDVLHTHPYMYLMRYAKVPMNQIALFSVKTVEFLGLSSQIAMAFKDQIKLSGHSRTLESDDEKFQDFQGLYPWGMEILIKVNRDEGIFQAARKS